jgi:hypothetical protein
MVLPYHASSSRPDAAGGHSIRPIRTAPAARPFPLPSRQLAVLRVEAERRRISVPEVIRRKLREAENQHAVCHQRHEANKKRI